MPVNLSAFIHYEEQAAVAAVLTDYDDLRRRVVALVEQLAAEKGYHLQLRRAAAGIADRARVPKPEKDDDQLAR